MNGAGTIDKALDFDFAVAAALSYAGGRDDTLVSVTADHETGGLAVLDPGDADERIEVLGGSDEVMDLTQFFSGRLTHRPTSPFSPKVRGHRFSARPERNQNSVRRARGCSRHPGDSRDRETRAVHFSNSPATARPRMQPSPREAV